jgi:hypothetical protein
VCIEHRELKMAAAAARAALVAMQKKQKQKEEKIKSLRSSLSDEKHNAFIASLFTSGGTQYLAKIAGGMR